MSILILLQKQNSIIELGFEVSSVESIGMTLQKEVPLSFSIGEVQTISGIPLRRDFNTGFDLTQTETISTQELRKLSNLGFSIEESQTYSIGLFKLKSFEFSVLESHTISDSSLLRDRGNSFELSQSLDITSSINKESNLGFSVGQTESLSFLLGKNYSIGFDIAQSQSISLSEIQKVKELSFSIDEYLQIINTDFVNKESALNERNTYNKLSSVIEDQFTDNVRDNHRLFISFLQTYYKYAQSRKNSIGIVQNHSYNFDIDETLPEYIDKFYSENSKYIPKNTLLDRRNFLKLLNQVYNSKGTEKSLKLVFRALFNEDISISYPSEQILRASDGVWVRENFVLVQSKYGDIPTSEFVLQLSNNFGEFSLVIHRTEQISDTTFRFYFNSSKSVNFSDNQVCKIFDSANQTVFIGNIVKTPATLKIQSKGKFWQVGQIITLPGTVRDTICQVTKVDSAGGILRLDIIQRGFIHTENQTYTVSPFKNKPSGAVVDIKSTIVLNDPLTIRYDFGISEYTGGASESILGISDGVSSESYFLESYVDTGYSGYVGVNTSYTSGNQSDGSVDTGLDIQDWLDSRVVLVFQSSNVVYGRGYFKTDSGKLSIPTIRLQDNFYYQAFSYVIESTKQISDYRSILGITHPAGTKMFGDAIQNTELTCLVESESAILIDA